MLTVLKKIFSFNSFEKQRGNVEEKDDFFSKIPDEIVVEIFSHLDFSDLAEIQRVSKRWKICSQEVMTKRVLGKKVWERYFGQVGDEPSLPKDFNKMLLSPCPFFPDKKVYQTHQIVLIPSHLNKKSHTLVNFLEVLKSSYPQLTPKGRQVIYSSMEILWGDKAADQPYWLMILKEAIEVNSPVLENSRVTLYQRKYCYPSVLEAISCIAMQLLFEGRSACSDDPSTYMKTSDAFWVVSDTLEGYARGDLKNGLRVVFPDNETIVQKVVPVLPLKAPATLEKSSINNLNQYQETDHAYRCQLL